MWIVFAVKWRNAELRKQGKKLFLVTSGFGCRRDANGGWRAPSHALHQLQAAASVGPDWDWFMLCYACEQTWHSHCTNSTHPFWFSWCVVVIWMRGSGINITLLEMAFCVVNEKRYHCYRWNRNIRSDNDRWRQWRPIWLRRMSWLFLPIRMAYLTAIRV